MPSDGAVFLRRAQWFLRELRSTRFPNASSFAEALEISTDTAQRVIDSLRDDYLAPIEYNRAQRGYYLEDQDWMMKLPPPSKNEILALALARHHLRQASESFLGGHLDQYWERLQELITPKIPELLLEDSLYSVEDTRRAPANDAVLSAIFQALLNGVQLKISYVAPLKKETTHRDVSPWHLRFVDGRLFLWVFCHLRQAPRLFQAVGITSARLTKQPATSRPDDFERKYLSGGLGHFFSEHPFEVRIRIDPPQARYVATERWHPSQRDTPIGEAIERTFLATHIKEVALRLLGLGDSVEVLSPIELKEEIARQARAIYERHR